VRWILSREPDFFEKQLPFIGYVQFRFEAQFHGGQRIRSLRAEVSYVMSGMYVEPKDEDSIQRARETLRDPIPWRFEAK
jgi:hypothetical protein